MARAKWATFGRDMAASNIRILKQTGKYGALRTPDQVWDYIEKVKQEQKSSIDRPRNARVKVAGSARKRPGSRSNPMAEPEQAPKHEKTTT